MKSRIQYSRLSAILGALAAGAGFHGVALAQAEDVNAEASSETQVAQDEAGGISEITVTAQRYEQNLQETPLSIVALDDEQLERQGIDSLANLDTFVPNVTIGGTAAQGNAIVATIDPGTGASQSVAANGTMTFAYGVSGLFDATASATDGQSRTAVARRSVNVGAPPATSTPTPQ